MTRKVHPTEKINTESDDVPLAIVGIPADVDDAGALLYLQPSMPPLIACIKQSFELNRIWDLKMTAIWSPRLTCGARNLL